MSVIFKDDFSGASLDTTKWTLTGGTSAISAGVITVTATAATYAELVTNKSTFGQQVTMEWYGELPQTTVGTVYMGLEQSIAFKHKWQDTTKTYVTGDSSEHVLDAKYTGNHTYKIQRSGPVVRFYIDGVLKYTVSSGGNLTPCRVYGNVYGQAGENTFKIDWLKVSEGRNNLLSLCGVGS